MTKRWAVLAVMAISLLISTAPVSAFQAGAGPLERMLAQVPDTGTLSRAGMWYGSLGDFARIMGFQVKSYADFQKLQQQQQAAYQLEVGTQVYYSPFSGASKPALWAPVFGIDPFTVDRELTVGQKAPEWYAILQGQFPAGTTIAQALKALGYKATPAGNGTLYSLGNDNAVSPNSQVGRLAAGNYNRLLVTDKQIIAAPSDAMIKASTATGKMIGSDPAYAALVRALEAPGTIPNTTLLSAALFNGPDLGAALNAQGLQPLPQYQAVGLGYRRDANNRFWVVALVYPDANSANQAQATLSGQLGTYASQTQGGRQLFQGWATNVTVVPSADNKSQVVIATMQLPEQTDVSLIDLVQSKDLGFLATH